MNNKLTLSESIYLLALDDEKGTILFTSAYYLPYGIAGAALMDLFLLDRIRFQAKSRVEVVDQSSTGFEFLDHALNIIDSSKKVKPAKYWVEQIGNQEKVLRQLMNQRLISNGTLYADEKSLLVFFKKKIYPTLNSEPELKLRSDLIEAVALSSELSDDQAMLLLLIHTCDMIKVVFPKELKKQAKKRAKEIAANNTIAKSIRAAMEDIQAAMFAVIAVGAVAASS